MICAWIASVVLSGPTALVLQGLDPLELARGREVQGSAELTFEYGRHRYRFANRANLITFQSAPHHYGVQMGGACGKMGALTGRGSPERWAVAHGKIYLFASDGCRSTFLKNEPAYFGEPRQAPRATAPQMRAAKAAFDGVLQAHGGADKIAKIASVEWNVLTPYKDGGVDKIWDSRYYFSQDGKFASWEVWDSGMAFFAVQGRSTAEGKPNESYTIHPDEVRALKAGFARTVSGILTGGRGTAIVLAEPVTFAGERCTVITVQRWGAVSDALVSQKSGRIVGIRFHDRYSGPVVDAEIEFSGYSRQSGVWLPTKRRVRTNGGQWGKVTQFATTSLNGPVPKVFASAFPG